MKLLKKIGIGFLALAASFSLASAANIPLISGPQDSSQIIAYLNQVIQAVNSGVTGKLTADPTSTATGTGTSEQILKTYTLPANTLASIGDTLRVTCSGSTAANTNGKTVKLYFGASAVTSASITTSAAGWTLQYYVTRNSTTTTQTVAGWGIASTVGVNPQIFAGTDDTSTALTIKCTGTDAVSSASDIVANQFIVELIK